ncbi:hypothetical protein [Paraburkholderia sp.]|uniref:hypothetical protein n=1 Tax=Paraburkholderia sp. TaxID=1926495 RepID=UPI0039E62A44
MKDGQLFWCAIGLCAAAIYEAVTALEQGGPEASMLAFGIVGFCGLAFVCFIVVTTSLLNVRHGESGAAIGEIQTEFAVGTFSRVSIGLSIFITCLVASSFAALHIHVN